jgi:hypothetical protein
MKSIDAEPPRTLVDAIEAVLREEEQLRERAVLDESERSRRRIRLLVDARVVLGGWRAGLMTSENARDRLAALVEELR